MRLFFCLVLMSVLSACSSLVYVDKSRLNRKPMLEDRSVSATQPFFFSEQGSSTGSNSSGGCNVCAH